MIESEGLMLIQGEDGVFKEYSDEYDLTLHFESEEEQERFIQRTFWTDAEYKKPPVDEDGCSEYLLLSFANYSIPIVGRYEEDPDGGGNFYAGDEDVPLIKQDLFVNAWMILPKCMEDEAYETE